MSDEQTAQPVEQTTIAGNVGQPPVKKTTAKGDVVNFTIAENMGKDVPPKWHRVAVWNEGLQNPVLKQIKKGSRVVATGKAYTTQYNGQDQFNMNAYRVGLVDYLFPEKAEPVDDEAAAGW